MVRNCIQSPEEVTMQTDIRWVDFVAPSVLSRHFFQAPKRGGCNVRCVFPTPQHCPCNVVASNCNLVPRQIEPLCVYFGAPFGFLQGLLFLVPKWVSTEWCKVRCGLRTPHCPPPDVVAIACILTQRGTHANRCIVRELLEQRSWFLQGIVKNDATPWHQLKLFWGAWQPYPR